MKTIFSFLISLSFVQFLASQPSLQWSPNLWSREKTTIRFNFYGLPAFDPNKHIIPAKMQADFPAYISPMPVAFQPYQQPFFCQLEYAMESKIKVPVRFRLGEVQYVDMLEGKSSYDRWMRTIGSAMNILVEKRDNNPFNDDW